MTVVVSPPANTPPVASFTYSCNGLECNFDGSASTDSDGDIVIYEWYFDDGKYASEAITSHTYAAAGSYSVTLGVTDDDGDTDTASQSITVTELGNSPPTASFTADPLTGPAPLIVDHDASNSSDPDNDPLTYSWNFGDTTSGTGEISSHVYSYVGTYTAVLTVDDGNGASDTATQSITITASPGTMHIGDLDTASASSKSSKKGLWWIEYTIRVHDAAENPVADAQVEFFLSDSSGIPRYCWTDDSGLCLDENGETVKGYQDASQMCELTLTVVNILHDTLLYEASENHDPDGDSDGTSITDCNPGGCNQVIRGQGGYMCTK